MNAPKEGTDVGSEAPERDDSVPPLQTPAMGVRAMARYRCSNVQSPRSLSEAAYEAGHKDGYGDGYVDGYDDGQYNQLIGLIRDFEEWGELCEMGQLEGLIVALQYLRERLEHDP
jgi:hypothetical protein